MKPITQPSRRYAGSCGIRLSDLVGALIALSQIIARGQESQAAKAAALAAIVNPVPQLVTKLLQYLVSSRNWQQVARPRRAIARELNRGGFADD